jgi:hypothetical protein
MGIRPQTVRRIATRSRRRALELSAGTRARESFAALPAKLGRTPVVLGVPATLGVAGLFLPNWFSIGAISRPSDGRSFLSTLWQVEGGTIALSLSLILVAFESIWRGRFRGSVRVFADEVLLLWAVSLAFTSLFVIGFTLIGWGTGAPGGWAATWCAILSALAFAAVPLVLVRTLLLMGPASAQKRRIDQIHAEVHDAVDAEAFERLAYGELKAAAERSPGLKLTPVLLWESSEGRAPIHSEKAGVVRDINIAALARVAKKRRTDDAASIVIGVRVGAYVPRGDDLGFITTRATRLDRWRVRRAFVVDTRNTRSRLYDVIAHVHEEAVRAIRDVQPWTYDDLSEVWVELLVGFPAAWRRYGHDFDETVAGEFGRFGLGPVDAVARNLFIEAQEATKSMPDIAAAAFKVPDIVVTRIVDLDASALLLRMLALYVELYTTAAEVDDPKLRKRLLHLVLELPAQYGRRVEHNFREYDLPIAERQRADRDLRIVFRTLMEQMKAVVDHDPADVERLATINSSWVEIFSGWHPEGDKHELWPGLPPDEEQLQREHNAKVDLVITQKDALESLRDAYRFALTYWALHQLRNSGDAAWLEVLRTLLPWLGPADRMAQEADDVTRIDLDRSIFLGWHSAPVQMGWAAPQAFIILTLVQHAADQIPPDLGRRNFLRDGMTVEIIAMLDSVEEDAALWELLGGEPDDLGARVEALRGAILASVAR